MSREHQCLPPPPSFVQLRLTKPPHSGPGDDGTEEKTSPVLKELLLEGHRQEEDHKMLGED